MAGIQHDADGSAVRSAGPGAAGRRIPQGPWPAAPLDPMAMFGVASVAQPHTWAKASSVGTILADCARPAAPLVSLPLARDPLGDRHPLRRRHISRVDT
jgi:hypothetical protein